MGLLEVKPEKNEEAKENDQVDVDLSSGCKGMKKFRSIAERVVKHEKIILEENSGILSKQRKLTFEKTVTVRDGVEGIEDDEKPKEPKDEKPKDDEQPKKGREFNILVLAQVVGDAITTAKDWVFGS
ncbi:hypothetical protein FNV43_RR13259 [Rhamnella rubrinervis]|uniref:Uncharacterized protein n=1 Tax=Rhamnella rubrinervis TaxID=2594499 RepID=A0A8K0MEY1_9ROSA|nr:hypothetical protein FNV43_RR13259 [Rhamnella rubrinervis]